MPHLPQACRGLGLGSGFAACPGLAGLADLAGLVDPVPHAAPGCCHDELLAVQYRTVLSAQSGIPNLLHTGARHPGWLADVAFLFEGLMVVGRGSCLLQAIQLAGHWKVLEAWVGSWEAVGG